MLGQAILMRVLETQIDDAAHGFWVVGAFANERRLGDGQQHERPVSWQDMGGKGAPSGGHRQARPSGSEAMRHAEREETVSATYVDGV